MALERTLLYGFAAVIALSPLPFGAVETWASATLAAACLGLGALWVVWRARRGMGALPLKDPVLIGGALFVLFGLLQTVPLPHRALERLSPAALALRAAYAPPVVGAAEGPAGPASRADAAVPAAHDSGRAPISLYPWATRQATLRFAACLMAALIAIDLAAVAPLRRVVVTALLASGAFQAVYGLGEYFSGRQHIFGYEKQYYTEVATGTFINRNHLAGYLGLTLPLALALAAAAAAGLWPRRGAPATGSLEGASGRRVFRTAACLVLALVMATALACTGSRMGIVSALFGLLSIGCLVAWRGRGRGYVAAVALVAGATLLLFTGADAHAPILDRFRRIMSEFQGGLGRGSIWAQAASMAAQFPLVGAGLGAFPHVFPGYRITGEGYSLAHAHNDYLELIAEVGAVGGAIALAALLLVARSIPRRPEGRPEQGFLGYAAASGLVAMLFHSLADFNLAIPSNALATSVVGGIAVWWLRAPVLALAVAERPPRARLAPALWAASLLAAGALVALAPALAGAVDQPESGGGELAGDAPVAAPRLDGDNADRAFAAAARLALQPTRDLEALAAAPAGDEARRAEAGRYIARRLEDALRMQARGLVMLPISGPGHVQMGRIMMTRCAAVSLAGTPEGRCLDSVVAEIARGLRLSPMSVSAHAEAARLLAGAWPLLGPEARTTAAPIVERANAMNPADAELRAALAAVGVAPDRERVP